MGTKATKEIRPVSSFYTVTVKIESEPDDRGKVTKSVETYLVDADDVADAQSMAVTAMEGCIGSWDITSVAKAKISGVITGE